MRETADGARDLRDDRAYAYDALRRLVSVTDREKKATTYGYDPVGNRTATSREGKLLESASYDAADQLTALHKGNGQLDASINYDANGNLIERRRGDALTTYAYDAADRLAGFTEKDRRSLFSYDGDGNLVREIAIDPDDPAASRTLDHTLDVAGPLSQVLTTSDGRDAASYLYGLGRIAAAGSSETRFFGTDVCGSPLLLTDERGQVAGVRGFDAWGVPDPGKSAANVSGPAALAELFGFTGERQDVRSGLLYLHARWYDPAIGRFLSRDPASGARSDPRTQHPYMYALDNPASFVDRTGRSASSLFDGGYGYAYDGRLFYASPSARPAVQRQSFGQQAAYAAAQMFADLDSPDPSTQAVALLKVSAIGIGVGVTAAAALPSSVVASAGSTLVAAGSGVVAGASWLFQRAQAVLPQATRTAAATGSRTVAAPGSGSAAQNAQRAIVIGERTERVRAAAERLGAEYYTPATKLATREENIRANLEWLYEKVQQGYRVLDIGPANTVPTSPYYNAETALLDALNYYAKWITVAP